MPRHSDDRPDDRPTEPAWYEQPAVIVAAAAAGLIAVALLVFAVMQTSRHSTVPSELPTESTVAPTTTHTLKSYTSTTTYTTMTSTEPVSPEPSPPEEPSPLPTVETSTDIPTVTTTFPYPTTTAPIAGAF